MVGLCAFVMSAQAAANWNAVAGVTAKDSVRPEGIVQGIYYDASNKTKVTLCTYAASITQAAKRVFLFGDMTDWTLQAKYQLYKDGNYFWITVTGLTPGRKYKFQYAVERADGTRKLISDLYSETVLHPDDKYEPKQVDPTIPSYPSDKGADGYVTVIQTNQAEFAWSDATLNFQRPNKNNLIIYELWVYDYTSQKSISGLMERLDYIQNLGVNAIELMPVCEFEGNYSWGYNPTHYFALDKAYGSPKMFKTFIDECHKRGIAVIMDMVFNHATGSNPMNKLYPYGTDLSSNPWFNTNPPHGDNVYEDWNHDFAPAHEMFIRALKYWIQEYKVDGYRLDLSHGLCGPSYNAVKNLKDYYQKGVKEADAKGDAYMILEHWGNNMGNDRPQLVSAGMMCWENTNPAYLQTAMGWLKPDGEGHTDAFTAANKKSYVSYCESHDEERMQYKAKKYGAGNLTTSESARIARVPEQVAFNVLLNGPHMLWQFEELGYDFSINCDAKHPDAENNDYRCSVKPRPEDYDYFTNADRVAAFTKCAQVITLRTQLMPDVFINNSPTVSVNSYQVLRTIKWSDKVYAVGNFSATSTQTATLPSGTWYDYLNGTAPASSSYSLAPGEFKVFTSTPVEAPTFADIEKRDVTPIENVEVEGGTKALKFLHDGQIYILRGDKIYTITGTLCTSL